MFSLLRTKKNIVKSLNNDILLLVNILEKKDIESQCF